MPGNYSVRNDTLCPAYGAALLALFAASATFAEAPANNFPTLARVEYVQECINRTGGKQTNTYQCVCVVDRIADAMSYDEFVESSMLAKYSTLPGERGGIFRDTDEAKEKAKLFRALESNAFKACNLSTSTAGAGHSSTQAPAQPPAKSPAPAAAPAAKKPNS